MATTKKKTTTKKSSDTVKYSATTGKKLKKGESTTDATGITYKQGDSFSKTVKKSSSGGSNSPNNSNQSIPAPKTSVSVEVHKFDPNTGAPLKPGQTVKIAGTNTYVTEGKSGIQNSPGVVQSDGVSTFALPSGNLQQGVGSTASPNQTVKTLQQLLKSSGINVTVDGIYGPQTKSAVMAFQQKNGLVVDGVVGPKTSAALSKAGSTAPSTAPVDAPIDQVPTEEPIGEIEAINEEFNDLQQQELDKLMASLGEDVEVSESSKLIESLVNSYNDNLKDDDEGPSLSEQLSKKRAELGVDAMETQINTIDAEIASIDNNLLNLNEDTDNSLRPVSQINRRKSEDQIIAERRKNALILERNSIANELNSKYSSIESIMKYAQLDYENAQDEYNTKFTQAMNLTNLLKSVEESNKSDKERREDTARANLQIIMESIKGQDFDTLDPKTKLDIRKIELLAGLPDGFTKFAAESINEPVVSMGSEFTDASGRRQVPVYTQDPVTGLITSKTITIGTAKTTGGGGSDEMSSSERKTFFQQFIKTGKSPDTGDVFGNAQGSDGFADPYVYIEAFENWPGTTQEFITAFNPAKYVNPTSYSLLPAAIKPVVANSEDDEDIFD